ncbi:CPBP family intramembrane metalloprotease [Myroides sp. JBRI-B21084]|uniref:CPBP family intramembrane glutamic endopeptidase n=1 Tax=Myroides sp. JBRI-B21084 TaxID=3119977 RepID=UPI0026E34856|nr:CPBP family intramembrane glutamic endopeptidase [Paenimyroides cloacae]WKW47428.1 CPBP family intramembrane metalloprotease [Paenimyroides cloacae]
MYLEQFKKDTPNILKYIPFVFCFLGFMALNVIVSNVLSLDAGAMIQDSINKMGKNFTFFSLLIPFAFFLILLFGWWVVIHKYSIKQLTTSRLKIDYNRILFSFSIWVLINIVLFAISYLLDPTSFQFQFNGNAFLTLLLISIIFIPIQTSFEEFFFRGYFMQFSAYATKSKAVALIITSVIFGLMHLSNPEVSSIGLSMMVFYIGTGFFLGLITLLDDGLELALGFHAANNLMGALLVTSPSAVFQTDALFVFNGNANIYEMIAQVFVILPILLFVFYKKYNWVNWKKKLFKPF